MHVPAGTQHPQKNQGLRPNNTAVQPEASKGVTYKKSEWVYESSPPCQSNFNAKTQKGCDPNTLAFCRSHELYHFDTLERLTLLILPNKERAWRRMHRFDTYVSYRDKPSAGAFSIARTRRTLLRQQ